MASRRHRGHSARRRAEREPAHRERPRPAGAVGWPERIGEAALLGLVVAVPLVISKDSRNICDVKDVVLGLGVALGLGVWLLAGLVRGHVTWVRSRLNAAVVAFLAYAAVSLIWSRYRYVTVSELGRLAANTGVYFLAVVSLRGLAQVRRLVIAAAFGAVPVSAYALYQAAGHDFIAWTARPGRVFSFLGNPTYLGGYLVLLIPVVIATAWPPELEPSTKESRRQWLRVGVSLFLAAVAAAMLLALYRSVTLSAIVGLAVGGVVSWVLILLRRGRRGLRSVLLSGAAAALLVGVIGALAYGRLPERQQARVQKVLQLQDPSGEERRLHWRVAAEVFRSHPVIGAGYGTYRIHALPRLAPEWYGAERGRMEFMLRPTYAHSEYLQALAELGMVGGLLLVALTLGGYGLSVRVAARHPKAAWARLGAAIVAGGTALLIQNAFGVTFRQTGVVTFFWLWLAVMVLAASVMGPSDEAAPTPHLGKVSFRSMAAWGLGIVALGLAVLVAGLSWVTIRPLQASVLVKRAQLAAGARDFEQAAQLADRTIGLCSYSAVGHFVSGYAWGQLGDRQKAIGRYERALQLMPANASVHYSLGCCLRREGELTKAEEHFRQSLALMPTSYKRQVAVAEVLLDQGRIAEAEACAREAVRLAPGQAQCHHALVEALSRQGKLDEALDETESALHLIPRDPKLRQYLATLLFRTGRHRQAARACHKWMAVDPKSPLPHNALGVYYLGIGKYGLARRHLLRAVELEPTYWRGHINLARTYVALGKTAAAIDQLRVVLAGALHQPERPEAKKMRIRLMESKARD